MRKTSKDTKPDTSQKEVADKEKNVSQKQETDQKPAANKNNNKTETSAKPDEPKAKQEAPKANPEKTVPTTAPSQEQGQNQGPNQNRNQAQNQKKSGGKLISTVALIVAVSALYVGYQERQQSTQVHSSFSERLDSTEQTLSGIDAAVQNALSTAKTANGAAQASQSTLQGLQSQSDKFKASLSQLEAKLGSSNAELVGKQSAIQQQVTTLTQQVSELSQQIQSQQQTPDASKTDWLIAEVTHLIKMANQQAQLAGNAAAAAAALETANTRLGEINDPSLLNVRKILTDKIVALRGAPQIDVTTVALTLSSLEGQADKLPLKSTTPSSYEPEQDGTAGTEEASGLASFFDKVWQDVKGLITIKQSGEDAAPALLPPGQQFFLQQNLRLKLETARLALLQGDTQLFQASIKTARQWLERYFDTNATSTANMLTTLSPYESMELNTSLPDAGDALKALEQWQSLRKQTAANTRAVEAGEVAQS